MSNDCDTGSTGKITWNVKILKDSVQTDIIHQKFLKLLAPKKAKKHDELEKLKALFDEQSAQNREMIDGLNQKIDIMERQLDEQSEASKYEVELEKANKENLQLMAKLELLQNSEARLQHSLTELKSTHSKEILIIEGNLKASEDKLTKVREENSKLRQKNTQLSRLVNRRNHDLQFIFDKLRENLPEGEIKPKSAKEALLA